MQTSFAESEFAAYTGHKYCVGLNSCGSALFLALWAAGVQDGDTVLSNALTFNAVPSAIYHARAKGMLNLATWVAACILVQVNWNLCVDLATSGCHGPGFGCACFLYAWQFFQKPVPLPVILCMLAQLVFMGLIPEVPGAHVHPL